MVTKLCDCYNRDPEESHDVNLIHQNFKFFQNMSIQLARQGVKNLGYHNYSLARRHISYRSLTTASTSSVNEEEIKFFSRLSSQWWDENGEFGLLHKMNPVRVQFIRDKLSEVAQGSGPEPATKSEKILSGLNILDIGSGGGLLSEVSLFQLQIIIACFMPRLESDTTWSKHHWH